MKIIKANNGKIFLKRFLPERKNYCKTWKTWNYLISIVTFTFFSKTIHSDLRIFIHNVDIKCILLQTFFFSKTIHSDSRVFMHNVDIIVNMKTVLQIIVKHEIILFQNVYYYKHLLFLAKPSIVIWEYLCIMLT